MWLGGAVFPDSVTYFFGAKRKSHRNTTVPLSSLSILHLQYVEYIRSMSNALHFFPANAVNGVNSACKVLFWGMFLHRAGN